MYEVIVDDCSYLILKILFLGIVFLDYCFIFVKKVRRDGEKDVFLR